MEKLKKIATVQDISCLGKCSLTVALPIISAMGVEGAIVPTAVLSTHTGGFTDYTFRDLSSDLDQIFAHWKSLNVKFDGLYSGFLGSISQIDQVKNFFKSFKEENTLVVVDPAMADNGKYYAIFNDEFGKKMVELCKEADLIIPNITESCFLTGTPFQEEQSEEFVESLMAKLSKISKNIIMTGVSLEEGKLGCCVFTEENGLSYHFEDKIDGYFHGTGDIFASVSVGAIMRGFTIEESAEIAAKYVCMTILETGKMNLDQKFGVAFEKTLPFLVDIVKNK